MRLILACLIFCNFIMCITAQDFYPHNEAIDIKQYVFQLDLNDSTDVIYGNAAIEVLFKKSITSFALDLVQKDAEKGMTVHQLLENGEAVSFQQKNDRVEIQCSSPSKSNEKRTYQIKYSGIPKDGLVISANKHGRRTFFGDNWPNRAHNWLPCIDHPSDKAKVDFIITAPDHYQVVANGFQMEETNLLDGTKRTHWRETIPLPMKVVVIGVAEFAVQYVGKVNEVPVYSWIFTDDREAGFYDYRIATKVLDFFQSHVAPYPYKKLANVQSKTRFGGMENASTIFYFENSVTGKREHEPLIAHEIAHQWFGNSASERYWHHLWLSEGFATYFTNLYLEHAYGKDKLKARMQEERDKVVKFTARSLRPVVDTSVKDYMKLLNPNSYQKGGWVLHMLRNKIGDDYFWEGIRSYYQRYQVGNAVTEDFQRVMEEVSGTNLAPFFKQWIYTAGHPQLNYSYNFDEKKNELVVSIKQIQGQLFEFPLEIGIYQEGQVLPQIETIQINQKKQEFRFPIQQAPSSVKIDPNVVQLFEIVED